MSTLKTDYTNAVFSGNRKYNMITNADGTVSFVDATAYTTEGDTFGASDINAINTEVNKALKNDTAVTVEQGGTGATTAADARTNLGLGNAATKGVDATPTDGSTNLVESNGVFDALEGKASSNHNQSASTITAGTLAGKVNANATAAATIDSAQVRDIYMGTADMVAGTTELATGTIYIMYE